VVENQQHAGPLIGNRSASASIDFGKKSHSAQVRTQPSPALGDAINAGIISTRCDASAATMAPLTVTAIDLARERIFAGLCELNRPTCGNRAESIRTRASRLDIVLVKLRPLSFPPAMSEIKPLPSRYVICW
jgi:hypothetical protein